MSLLVCDSWGWSYSVYFNSTLKGTFTTTNILLINFQTWSFFRMCQNLLCPCLCWHTGTTCCGSWRWSLRVRRWKLELWKTIEEKYLRFRSHRGRRAHKLSSWGQTFSLWKSPAWFQIQILIHDDILVNYLYCTNIYIVLIWDKYVHAFIIPMLLTFVSKYWWLIVLFSVWF